MSDKKIVIKETNKPYVCPVCKGTTLVKIGFYPDIKNKYHLSNCRTCEKTGIVWSKEVDL